MALKVKILSVFFDFFVSIFERDLKKNENYWTRRKKLLGIQVVTAWGNDHVVWAKVGCGHCALVYLSFVGWNHGQKRQR